MQRSRGWCSLCHLALGTQMDSVTSDARPSDIGSCQCLHPHYARVPSWSSAKIASQYTLGTITQDLQRTQPSNNDSSELLLKNGTSRESLSIVVGHPCFRNCTTGAELGLFQSAVGFVLQIQASLGAVETTPPTLISQSLPNRAGPSPFTTCRVS